MTNDKSTQAQAALWDLPTSSGAAREPDRRRESRPTATRPTKPMEFTELWTVDEVANYLGVPKQTIYCWRTSGYGPQGFRVGKHLRWRAATVIAWTVEMEQRQ